jgi:hypothetical protein
VDLVLYGAMIFDRWQEALTPVSTQNTEAERTGVGRGTQNKELQNYNKKVVYRVDTEKARNLKLLL